MPKKKAEVDYNYNIKPNLTEVRRQKIAELVKKAKGEDRTLSKYAEDAEISLPALNKIIGGKYTPSPTTMKKLTSEKAAPRGGVTYNDLMEAAGYESAEATAVEPDEIETEYYDPSNQKANAQQRLSRLMEIKQAKEYEKILMSQLYLSLVEQGFAFQKTTDGNLSVELIHQDISYWSFETQYYPEDHGDSWVNNVFQLIAKTLCYKYDDTSKISIIINHERTFEIMRRYEHALAFRGELSLVLFDAKEQKFVDEFYLSNYVEGDQSKEIFLVRK